MKPFGVQVPGKILLAGEYSVLEGGTALSLAMAPKMRFSCWTSTGSGLHIHSDLWSGTKVLPFTNAGLERESDRSEDKPALEELMLEVWRENSGHLAPVLASQQVSISITSEFGPQLGLGSSSAFLLGVYLCLLRAAQTPALVSSQAENELAIARNTLEQAADLARTVQLRFQGASSGYDVLTQCLGGLVQYRWLSNHPRWKYEVQNSPLLNVDLNWLHFVSNRQGAPTQAFVRRGRAFFAENPDCFQELTKTNAALQAAFLQVIADAEANLDPLITAMEAQRSCLGQTPLLPLALCQFLAQIPGCGKSWSFKSTGAGGEDIFLVVAKIGVWNQLQPQLAACGMQELDLAVSPVGATWCATPPVSAIP